MNLKHLDLVAWSLARAKAMADAPAKLFLSRLSHLDPTLPRLFGKGGVHDRRALARVHLLASAGFRNDRVPAVLRNFAERCRRGTIGYRAQAVIMSAALWTLQYMLGAGFTLADREAWIAYQQQLTLMVERAAQFIGRARDLRPG
jgi:hypothetical protein